MPVDLTMLPEAAKRKKPPVLKRWFIFIAIFISLSAFVNIAIWPAEKIARDVFFWHCVFTIPFFFSLFFLTIRWLFFLSSEFPADAWDSARESDIANEIERGRRFIVVAGYGVYLPHLITSVRLSEQFLLPDGVTLPVVVDDKTRAVTHQAKFPDHGNEYFVRITEKIHYLLSDIHIQTALSQHDSRASVTVVVNASELSLLSEKEVISLRDYIVPLLPASSVINFMVNYSLADIDCWLDHPETTDILLILSINLKESLDDGDAEAAVSLLLYSSSYAEKNNISGAKIHRPELTNDMSSISNTVSKTLLWGSVNHDEIASVWLTGMGEGYAYSTFFSSHNLVFPKAESSAQLVIIDVKSGYTGNVAPWLAIILAGENSYGDHYPQLVMSLPDKNAPPWWLVVHPSESK